jgi:hypothetical protein
MTHRRNWTGLCTLLVVALIATPCFASRAEIGRRPSGNAGENSLAKPNLTNFSLRLFDGKDNTVTGKVRVFDAYGGGLIETANLGPDGLITLTGIPGQVLRVEMANELNAFAGRAAKVILPDTAGSILEVAMPAQQAIAPRNGMIQNQAKALGDTCGEAEGVGIGGVSSPLTIVGFGGPDPDMPTAACNAIPYGGGDVQWISVVGDGTTLTATTCGLSTLDTRLTVWLDCGNNCADLICVTANDDDLTCAASAFHSTVNWASAAGETYKIAVHGFAVSSSGTTSVAVSSDGATASGQIVCPIPTGACCDCRNSPFNCQQLTEDDCAAQGGTYSGDNTTCCGAPTGVTQTNTSSPGLVIPDNSTVSDTMTIPAAGPDVTGDVNIQLDIAHTFIGDLSIDVTHFGATENIWDFRCGGQNDIRATADDDGTETLCVPIGAGPSTTVIYNQPIASLGSLSNLECGAPSGAWTLTITDGFAGDTGNLESWSVIQQLSSPACAAGPTSASAS